MRFVACEKIVGYGTDKVDIKVEIPARTHYLKRNAMLLEAIGIRGRCNALSINKSKLDNEWLISLHIPNDVKVIGLSLGTNPMRWKAKGVDITYDVKSWPLERWVAVANELIAEGYFVVMIGGPKEREEIKQKDLNFPNDKHLIDLVGSTTIKQSLTIINRCSLIVGSEGGMLHCASALGVKTLTIFGGSDYKMWNPGGDYSPMISKDYDCSPCFFTSKAAYCDYHKCLLDISVNDVIKKISCILGDLDS
jgi:ADP-heptose:LPS heptosyltransferase